MKGRLDVVEKSTMKIVARLDWQGTMWSGAAAWTAEAAMKKKLESIAASRQDLVAVQFNDLVGDGFGVRGWRGFAGWFQALTLSLPAYGLGIDPESVVWPFSGEAREPEEIGAPGIPG